MSGPPTPAAASQPAPLAGVGDVATASTRRQTGVVSTCRKERPTLRKLHCNGGSITPREERSTWAKLNSHDPPHLPGQGTTWPATRAGEPERAARATGATGGAATEAKLDTLETKNKQRSHYTAGGQE